MEPTALAGVVGWLGAVGAGMVPSGWCIEEKASIACCPHGSLLFYARMCSTAYTPLFVDWGDWGIWGLGSVHNGLFVRGSCSSGVGIQHASEKNIPVPETAEAG